VEDLFLRPTKVKNVSRPVILPLVSGNALAAAGKHGSVNLLHFASAGVERLSRRLVTSDQRCDLLVGGARSGREATTTSRRRREGRDGQNARRYSSSLRDEQGKTQGDVQFIKLAWHGWELTKQWPPVQGMALVPWGVHDSGVAMSQACWKFPLVNLPQSEQVSLV
jgi:hypothetical protein